MRTCRRRCACETGRRGRAAAAAGAGRAAGVDVVGVEEGADVALALDDGLLVPRARRLPPRAPRFSLPRTLNGLRTKSIPSETMVQMSIPSEAPPDTQHAEPRPRRAPPAAASAAAGQGRWRWGGGGGLGGGRGAAGVGGTEKARHERKSRRNCFTRSACRAGARERGGLQPQVRHGSCVEAAVRETREARRERRGARGNKGGARRKEGNARRHAGGVRGAAAVAAASCGLRAHLAVHEAVAHVLHPAPRARAQHAGRAQRELHREPALLPRDAACPIRTG